MPFPPILILLLSTLIISCSLLSYWHGNNSTLSNKLVVKLTYFEMGFI